MMSVISISKFMNTKEYIILEGHISKHGQGLNLFQCQNCAKIKSSDGRWCWQYLMLALPKVETFGMILIVILV